MSKHDVKAFWDSSPCNIRHSQKTLGSVEYFQEVSEKKFKAEPHIIKFLETQKWEGKQVLDAGCGLGTISQEFINCGATVTCIDFSEESLKLAKMRFSVFGLEDKVTAFPANIETIAEDHPEIHEKFDLVWSFGVVHHTPNPSRAIEQLYQLCKPGGTIKLMLYSLISWKAFNAMHESGTWEMSTLKETIRVNAEAQYGCPVAYVYSFDDIRKLLEPVGFEIVSLEKDHIFTWDVEEYKKGNWVKSKEWQGVSNEELYKYEKELGWHTLVTAVKQ